MADTTFHNIVNGERVAAASGETYDVIDPTAGEVYARASIASAILSSAVARSCGVVLPHASNAESAAA